MRDLLTMTSGLEWNGFRDYNIFTMPDRVNDALTLGVDHPAGRYYEYAQSPVALLAEATGRAAGEDPQAFFQRELLDTLGIPADAWEWKRDRAGHIAGFMGVNMRPDDFGRLGELLRRGGVWRGQRLLSEEYVRDAVAPSRTNGCYGWLIWVNAGKPCIGVTIQERAGLRDARHARPAGRHVPLLRAVRPARDGVPVAGHRRRAHRPGPGARQLRPAAPAGSSGLYEQRARRRSPTRRSRRPATRRRARGAERTNADYGFQTALFEPDRYQQGANPDPLPPAGPRRARAAQLALVRATVGRTGVVAVRVELPAARRAPAAAPAARGWTARASGFAYSIAAGSSRTLRFKLSARRLRQLRRQGTLELGAVALNRAEGGSTITRRAFTVRRAGA